MSDLFSREGAPPRARTENVSRYRVILHAFAALAFAWAFAVAALLMVGSAQLFGQEDTGTLSGTVSDPTGAAVPGATVTIANKDTSVKHVVLTNDTGSYTVPSLTPGNNVVTVSKTGFGNFRESGIDLQVAQIATVNAKLTLGSASDTVEVSASTAFLDTTDASLGTVIPQQQVTDLPLNGRQFSQLLQLAPGTVPLDVSQNAGKAPNFGSGAGSPAVDGQTNRSNLFLLDGIIASNPFFGGFSFSPSVDAIQEFKAQSHTDQAEFGQATGAVVSVVSRSGANSIHGAAYEFLRNQAFDATNYFDTVKAPYHQNQFGASFGGPLKKDKLFYYANYEGGRLIIGSSSANYSTVPTAAERSGDFSGLLPGNVTATIYDPSTYNPTTYTEQPFAGNKIPQSVLNSGMLAYLNGIYPMPNQAANAAGENNYNATNQSNTVNDQGSIRVDYAVGQKDSINGRYTENRATLASPSSLANLFETGFSGENTGATWVHTFSSSLIGEITGGYNRLNIPQAIFTPVDQAALFTASGVGAGFNSNPGDTTVVEVPGYSLEGGNYSGYWNGAGPIGPMNIVQVGGTVTKTKASHSLKFGASYYHTWMYTNWNDNNMDFSYKGTWNAACQFVGTPDSDSYNAAAAAQCPTYNPNAGNLGAGGDPVASMLLSVLDRKSIVTAHYGDFSPRLGFAYQITPRTTLRLGAGRTFDDWGLP